MDWLRWNEEKDVCLFGSKRVQKPSNSSQVCNLVNLNEMCSRALCSIIAILYLNPFLLVVLKFQLKSLWNEKHSGYAKMMRECFFALFIFLPKVVWMILCKVIVVITVFKVLCFISGSFAIQAFLLFSVHKLFVSARLQCVNVQLPLILLSMLLNSPKKVQLSCELYVVFHKIIRQPCHEWNQSAQ